MPDGQVLEFTNVTKRFNEVTAVSDFSARVEPGAVTAFLGPNGAGKTTTLRILLGQVRATSGTATIGGTAYAELRQPLRTIGAVLEETVYRPRRSANRQLTIAAKANGIPLARVEEVLGMVGLEGEGDSRIGGFSLGMRQRLGVAHALLGDPGALVFDEPANGLDPEGIRWMRLLMRRLADEGRTVLVSSHLLSEVEQVADNVLVLSKGQLVLASGIETLADPNGGSVVVDAADRGALTTALSAAGFDVEVLRSGLTVRGGDAGTVGAVAAAAGIALSTLVQRGPTLEDVFIELVRGGKLGPRAEAAASKLVAPEITGAIGTGLAGAGLAGVAGASVAAGSVGDDADAGESDDTIETESLGDESDDDAPTVDQDAVDENTPAADSDGESPADEEIAVEQTTVEVSLVETLASGENVDDEGSGEDSAEVSTDDAALDAPASDAVDENVDDEGHSSDSSQDGSSAEEEAPTRSFDEILFGSNPQASPADSDGAADGNAAEGEGTELSADAADDHAGVEFFTELGSTDATGDTPAHDAPAHDAPAHDAPADDAESAGVTAEPSTNAEPSTEADEEDPRSTAVSSMLAAAARAYYEDEPKDYPQGDPQGHAPSDDGAHWSVESTGVIDTVPFAAPSEDSTDGDGASDQGSADDLQDDGEHLDNGEHHDENHDGGEHHDENHGEDHEGEHHQG